MVDRTEKLAAVGSKVASAAFIGPVGPVARSLADKIQSSIGNAAAVPRSPMRGEEIRARISAGVDDALSGLNELWKAGSTW